MTTIQTYLGLLQSAGRLLKARAKSMRRSGRPLEQVPESALPRGGMALGERVQHYAEKVFGRRFGEVRIHADEESASLVRALDAHAIAVGNHIYFGAGEFQPETKAGRALIAHELTHVLQGGEAGGTFAEALPEAATRLAGVGDHDGRAEFAEREADAVERAVLTGGPLPAIGHYSPTGVRRKKLVSAKGSRRRQVFKAPVGTFLPPGGTAGRALRGKAEFALYPDRFAPLPPGKVRERYEIVGFTEVVNGRVTRFWGCSQGPDGCYIENSTEVERGVVKFDVVRCWSLAARVAAPLLKESVTMKKAIGLRRTDRYERAAEANEKAALELFERGVAKRSAIGGRIAPLVVSRSAAGDFAQLVHGGTKAIAEALQFVLGQSANAPELAAGSGGETTVGAAKVAKEDALGARLAETHVERAGMGLQQPESMGFRQKLAGKDVIPETPGENPFEEGLEEEAAAFKAQGGKVRLGGQHDEYEARDKERAVERALSRARSAARPRAVLPGLTGSGGTVPAVGGAVRLAGPALEYVEHFFGRSFGDVRIHTGPRAERAAAVLQAHAFTTGKDVYFGRGEFNPQTPRGMALLVHELTHVVQQDSGSVRRSAVAGIGADVLALETLWRRDGVIQARSLWGGLGGALTSVGGALGSAGRTLGRIGDVFEAIGGGLGGAAGRGGTPTARPDTGKGAGQVGPGQVMPGQAQPGQGLPGQALPGQSQPQVAALEQKVAQQATAGPGLPLELSTKQKLEEALEADLSQVRVHAGPAATQATKQVGAEAFQAGQNIVLGEKAAAQVESGDIATLAHEAAHVVQQQKGEADKAKKNPFAQWLLEQTARLVETKVPALSQSLHLAEFLRAPETAEKVTDWLDQLFQGEKPGVRGPTAQQKEREAAEAAAAKAKSEEEAEAASAEELIQSLMRFYGVRPHIGEEEFLDELTERVMDLMEAELEVERERRHVEAPF